MNETCPKCGALPVEPAKYQCGSAWQIGTSMVTSTQSVRLDESRDCLRAQVAQLRAKQYYRDTAPACPLAFYQAPPVRCPTCNANDPACATCPTCRSTGWLRPIGEPYEHPSRDPVR